MKVCVVGAGVSGLAGAKHCLEIGYECDVYEQTGNVGGLWNYKEEIDVDKNGIPVHTVMYENLRTNLPKEIMKYVDYPYPETMEESYLTQPEVLTYIKNYAEHFHLFDKIKFYHQVVDVTPISNQRWRIKTKDLTTKIETTQEYDAIMICNGHHSAPHVPEVPFRDKYEGIVRHSCQFRKTEPFLGKKVLIVGSGSSGCNIAGLLIDVAKKIILSCSSEEILYPLDKRVVKKGIIKEFYEDGVVFRDNTKEECDEILFCTGYRYSFPFLSPDCRVRLEDNCVKNLYKHIINVEHPTMGFIGVNYLTFIFPMVDIQVRFFLASLKGNCLLSRNEMLDDIEKDIKARLDLGWDKRHLHKLGSDFMYDYYTSLAKISNIQPLPNVMYKIYETSRERKLIQDRYKTIDDENFVLLTK